MNFRAVFAILGFLLLLVGGLMALSLPFSLHFGGGDAKPLSLSVAATLGTGAVLWFLFRNHRQGLRKREGFIIVASGWIFASLFGCLPYVLSGHIPSFTDAFFETMSGFTTTGATVLSDIEKVPEGLLFWRATTQWIGGMGIILLSLAILPMLGVGGMQLFFAEASHITTEKLTPRINATARRLWSVYCVLTAAQTVSLMFGGLSFYEALAHSLATVASGGFSTKNASVAHYSSPYVQYVFIFFMFASAVNYALHFRALVRRNPKSYLRDDEFVFFAFLILAACAAVFAGIPEGLHGGMEERFRTALFQVVSIISSTGFITGDYELWAPASQLVLVLIMVHGGCAGSTSGGLKVGRLLLLLKNGINEIRRLIKPKAIFVVRHNGNAVNPDIITSIQAFFILWITVFAFSTLAVTASGVDIMTAATAVNSTMSNVGPGLGTVGALENFGHLPAAAKWVLSLCMLTGRLELFTILVLFAPSFWKR